MKHNPHPLSASELVRLAELAEKLRDNSIEDAEVAELETLIAISPAACEVFASLAMLTAELEHVQGRITLPHAPTECHVQTSLWEELRALCQNWLRPLTVAASIMLVTLVAWQLTRPARPAPKVVASVCHTSGAILHEKNKVVSTLVGDSLSAGSYELTSGIMQFSYTNGVMVLMESPAKFELCGTMLVKLQTGKLSAVVPPAGIGFSVESPSATIVDLGTEFGVNASAAQSEVHVFKGKVLVETSSTTKPQTITEHKATRIDTATGTPSGIDYDPQMFIRKMTEDLANQFAEKATALHPFAQYRMRIMSDNTMLKDGAPFNHDGKIILGRSLNPWVTGRVGSALKLRGTKTDSYAMVPNWPLMTNNTISLFAWVKANSRPRWASIAKNWAINPKGNFGGQFHFGLHDDDGALEVHVNNAANLEVGVRDVVPLPIGQWQFVTFTLDGKVLRLYRNGREVASTPCAGLTTFAPSLLGIGVRLDETGKPDGDNSGIWDGAIDELTVFKYALSSQQIKDIYDTYDKPAGPKRVVSLTEN
jgi:hypothetical protein